MVLQDVAPHVPPVAHAWEQQEPAKQTPNMHWSLAVHGVPTPTLGWQLPAPTPSQ
jgi:hypothetical protein